MQLGTIEKLDIRSHWKHEEGDFTPWLAKEMNIQLLANELGLELDVTGTEQYIGAYKADIVAADGDGRRVIIENQLERTDHKHLGQIITYASGINAKILIWLCREVTEEHRKAIDWLNEVTNADISFFACEIELWKIGNSLPAPRFHIIASPNDWSKSMQASNTSNGLLTETKKGHLAFWNGLKTYMEEHGTDLRLRSPRPQHWYTLAVGRSKFSISLTTNTQLKRVGCEIYIRGENAKNAFHQLKKHYKQIETSLGYELDWKELPDGQDSRIGIYIDGDSTDPACWDNLHSTLKGFAENFYTIFSPLIRSLKL